MFRSTYILFCLCLLMVLVVPVSAKSLGPQNPPYGFYEFTWGIDVCDLLGFSLLKSDKYGKDYSRKNENTAFEGVPINAVTYKTFDNKFHMVTVMFSGENNFEKLFSNFNTKYGDYSELKSEQGFSKYVEYSWYFNYLGASSKKHLATVRLTYNHVTKSGEFSFSNRQLGPPPSLFFK